MIKKIIHTGNEMKKYLLATVVFVCSSVFAHSNESINIEGNYFCTGTEFDTKAPFKCDESIKKSGDTYAFTATCNDGTSYVGTGIFDSKQHNLSIAFRNNKNLKEVGISVKSIRNDGKMIGKWTNLDKSTIGRTNCTKQKNK